MGIKKLISDKDKNNDNINAINDKYQRMIMYTKQKAEEEKKLLEEKYKIEIKKKLNLKK